MKSKTNKLKVIFMADNNTDYKNILRKYRTDIGKIVTYHIRETKQEAVKKAKNKEQIINIDNFFRELVCDEKLINTIKKLPLSRISIINNPHNCSRSFYLTGNRTILCNSYTYWESYCSDDNRIGEYRLCKVPNYLDKIKNQLVNGSPNKCFKDGKAFIRIKSTEHLFNTEPLSNKYLANNYHHCTHPYITINSIKKDFKEHLEFEIKDILRKIKN